MKGWEFEEADGRWKEEGKGRKEKRDNSEGKVELGDALLKETT